MNSQAGAIGILVPSGIFIAFFIGLLVFLTRFLTIRVRVPCPSRRANISHAFLFLGHFCELMMIEDQATWRLAPSDSLSLYTISWPR